LFAKAMSETGGINITLYGFSIMKESLEKSIYPGFVAKWKQEHGQTPLHVVVCRLRNSH